MVTTRKRRVNDDDDDDDEDDGAGGTSMDMVDRLKRRAAKTAEKAREKKKSPTTSSSVANKSPPVKEQSIPKKPRNTQSIPKKPTDDKIGKKSEGDSVKKEIPSLLSEMKKPPLSKPNQGKSNGGKGNSAINKNKTRPFHSSWGAVQNPASPSGVSSVMSVSANPPPSPANLVDLSGPADATKGSTALPTRKVEESGGDKLGSGLRQLVLDGLRDLCKDRFEVPPERNGVDLFASFLRHKDLNPTIRANGNNIDTATNLKYDFFDVDETTGSIVLQPKIPIFPEDFATAGTQEWPLSWWGIVDPVIGKENDDDKKESQVDADAETRSKTPKDRSGARSESVKDDRKSRDKSRQSRKRSSRDAYDDEHAYYGGYSDRRDRFHAEHYNDGGDGYPPHGTDYDYDYTGQPPSWYHPGSRNPSHRNGGGPPYPQLPSDGPPPHSRPYLRDGPPPRDFRDGPPPRDARGGGGRPYPMHWDPHGPQGRGPPPPRDDRRDHRDRSQRSPRSKSERDDGRHSVRKPSSGKERNQTSR